ncbi:hypothetical protein SCP_0100220 [Sparassis crispa]|uniref:Uncharacterized protein n=1 Tax=Sparassis crispa TaxID=139825 RepID=A0A401G4R9_9APHY|nr:hypothetical protein SCP_0100220 [Sparassis crispa]GBE77150.1 hypothetical protein SCP_0100220 [Sparassis crispa]
MYILRSGASVPATPSVSGMHDRDGDGGLRGAQRRAAPHPWRGGGGGSSVAPAEWLERGGRRGAFSPRRVFDGRTDGRRHGRGPSGLPPGYVHVVPCVSAPPRRVSVGAAPSVSIRAADICTPIFDAPPSALSAVDDSHDASPRRRTGRGAHIPLRESPAIAGRVLLLLLLLLWPSQRSAVFPSLSYRLHVRTSPTASVLLEPAPAPRASAQHKPRCVPAEAAGNPLLSSSCHARSLDPRPADSDDTPTTRPLSPPPSPPPPHPHGVLRRWSRRPSERERRVSNVPPLASLYWRARIQMLLGLPHARGCSRPAAGLTDVGYSLSARLRYVSLRELRFERLPDQIYLPSREARAPHNKRARTVPPFQDRQDVRLFAGGVRCLGQNVTRSAWPEKGD